MTKYTVIQTGNLHILIRVVNEQMEKGWHPVGGASFDGNNYLQAMILEK